jgi:hypothetical protein
MKKWVFYPHTTSIHAILHGGTWWVLLLVHSDPTTSHNVL